MSQRELSVRIAFFFEKKNQVIQNSPALLKLEVSGAAPWQVDGDLAVCEYGFYAFFDRTSLMSIYIAYYIFIDLFIN